MSLGGSSLSSLEQCLKMALSMKNKLTDRFVDFVVILNQHCYWKRRSMKALKKKNTPFFSRTSFSHPVSHVETEKLTDNSQKLSFIVLKGCKCRHQH